MERERFHRILTGLFSESNRWVISLGAMGLWLVSLATGLFSLAYYLTVPMFFYLIGSLLRLGPLRKLGFQVGTRSFLEEAIIDILHSILVTSAVALILNFLFQLNSLITIGCYGSIFLILALVAGHETRAREKEAIRDLESLQITKELKYALFGILAFSVAFVLIRLSLYPWPTTAGTDTFSHLAAINQILYDHGTAKIIDGYPYIFHTLVAVLCLLSGGNPLWVISNIYPFIYPYSLILSFLFLYFITKNSILSFVATLCTLCVYEHGGLLATYFPFPSSFAFIFLYTSYIACLILRPSYYNAGLIVSLVTLTIFMYPSALFVSVPILAYLLVRTGFLPKTLSILYKFIFGGIIIAGGILILVYYAILPLLSIPAPVITLNSSFTIIDNLDNASLHFNLGYSQLQGLGLVTGLVICWLAVQGKRIQHKWTENTNYGFIALLGTAYLIIFFTPMRYVHRTELYLRPIYSLLIVVVAYTIALLLIQSVPFLRTVAKRKSDILVLILLLLIMMPISAEKTVQQGLYLAYGETRTPDADEFSAFTWIASRTTPGDYILTDMATGYIMRGTVFRNASTAFTLDGESKSPNSFPDLTQRIFDFLNSSLDTVNTTISALLDDETFQSYATSIAYIMISPRTNMWISRARDGSFIRTASYQFDLGQNDTSWAKFNSSLFEVVYSIGDVRVLQFNFNLNEIVMQMSAEKLVYANLRD